VDGISEKTEAAKVLLTETASKIRSSLFEVRVLTPEIISASESL